MFEVELYDCDSLPDNLPETLKQCYSDPYDYRSRTLLVVKHKDEIILDVSDGGEPEDNSFSRDWDWVPSIIEKAYDLGYKDARESNLFPSIKLQDLKLGMVVLYEESYNVKIIGKVVTEPFSGEEEQDAEMLYVTIRDVKTEEDFTFGYNPEYPAYAPCMYRLL